MSKTRSLTSQVSYFAGIYFTAALGGRVRFGDELWLEDVADELFVTVVKDDAAADCDSGTAYPSRFKDIGNARGGPGAVSEGETERPLRFAPLILGNSGSDELRVAGGEYCVPTSTFCFGRDFVGDLVEVEEEWERLWECWLTFGEHEGYRRNAVGDGGVMKE